MPDPFKQDDVKPTALNHVALSMPDQVASRSSRRDTQFGQDAVEVAAQSAHSVPAERRSHDWRDQPHQAQNVQFALGQRAE
jgi:hypothetical protein